MNFVAEINQLSQNAEWFLLGILFLLCLTALIGWSNAAARSDSTIATSGQPATQNEPRDGRVAWKTFFSGRNVVAFVALVLLLVLAKNLYVPETENMVLTIAGGRAPRLDNITALSLFGAIIMTAMAALPVAAFVVRGWKIKQADVMSSLNKAAIGLYVETFLADIRYEQPETCDESVAAFCRMYDYRYGRYRLREPSILLALTLFPLALLVSHTALMRLQGDTCTGGACPLVLPGQALAAISGAYAFVITNLVRSALTYNLPPLVMVNAALRLLVAAPVGYAVATFGTDGKSAFIAFAIGAFPLDEVQTIFRRLVTKYLNPSTANPVTNDATDKTLALDGIDQPTSESLASMNITTALQLAYCDPVQVALGANIGFDVMMDLQSEALAYIYLGGTLDLIRPIGLRGAVEIHSLMELEKNEKDKDKFTQTLKSVSTTAKMDDAGLRNCFHEIAYDPYTEFLVHAWANRNRPDEKNK